MGPDNEVGLPIRFSGSAGTDAAVAFLGSSKEALHRRCIANLIGDARSPGSGKSQGSRSLSLA